LLRALFADGANWRFATPAVAPVGEGAASARLPAAAAPAMA
jgi:hypothetical protein